MPPKLDPDAQICLTPAEALACYECIRKLAQPDRAALESAVAKLREAYRITAPKMATLPPPPALPPVIAGTEP